MGIPPFWDKKNRLPMATEPFSSSILWLAGRNGGQALLVIH
jgi:hypothetical protein